MIARIKNLVRRNKGMEALQAVILLTMPRLRALVAALLFEVALGEAPDQPNEREHADRCQRRQQDEVL